MANIHQILRSGITTKLVGTSNDFRTAITADVSGTDHYKLYFHESPQNYIGTSTPIALPVVVFDFQDIRPTKDSGSRYYPLVVTFNIGSNTIAGAEEISGYLYDLLEEATITFTGYSTVIIKCQLIIPMGKIENVWNIAQQYFLELQK